MLIFQDKVLHHHAAILAERALHGFQLRTDFGEVEAQNHIAVVPPGRMPADMQLSKEFFKSIGIVDAVVRLQHGQEQ